MSSKIFIYSFIYLPRFFCKFYCKEVWDAMSEYAPEMYIFSCKLLLWGKCKFLFASQVIEPYLRESSCEMELHLWSRDLNKARGVCYCIDADHAKSSILLNYKVFWNGTMFVIRYSFGKRKVKYLLQIETRAWWNRFF